MHEEAQEGLTHLSHHIGKSDPASATQVLLHGQEIGQMVPMCPNQIFFLLPVHSASDASMIIATLVQQIAGMLQLTNTLLCA